MNPHVSILRYGVQEVPGPQAFFQAAWGEWVSFSFYAFLIEVDGSRVLIDCGMDDPGPLNALLLESLGERGLIRLSPGESRMTDLLGAHGLTPADIDFVAFTHFHADHVSNARLFPRARFVVSADGWRRYHATRATCPAMVPDPVFPADVLDYLAQVLEERVVLVEDGPTPIPHVAIHYVGGHTVDSAAFTVETDVGRVVIPGDTIWTQRNIDENRPVGSAVDIAQCYEAMDWARSAADVLLPTHESDLMARFPGGRVS